MVEMDRTPRAFVTQGSSPKVQGSGKELTGLSKVAPPTGEEESEGKAQANPLILASTCAIR